MERPYPSFPLRQRLFPLHIRHCPLPLSLHQLRHLHYPPLPLRNNLILQPQQPLFPFPLLPFLPHPTIRFRFRCFPLVLLAPEMMLVNVLIRKPFRTCRAPELFLHRLLLLRPHLWPSPCRQLPPPWNTVLPPRFIKACFNPFNNPLRIL